VGTIQGAASGASGSACHCATTSTAIGWMVNELSGAMCRRRKS
jgi:hypothetical protein